jgi:hypothetical protein
MVAGTNSIGPGTDPNPQQANYPKLPARNIAARDASDIVDDKCVME